MRERLTLALPSLVEVERRTGTETVHWSGRGVAYNFVVGDSTGITVGVEGAGASAALTRTLLTESSIEVKVVGVVSAGSHTLVGNLVNWVIVGGTCLTIGVSGCSAFITSSIASTARSGKGTRIGEVL